MNLWVFLLLGFLAQTSNGCTQYSFPAVEGLTMDTLNAVFSNLNGSNFPDTETDSTNKIGGVSVSGVTINPVAQCNNEGKVVVNATGTITITSDSLSDAAFNYKVSGVKEFAVGSGHLIWRVVPGSLSMAINLDSKLICKQSGLSASEQVEKAFVRQCQLFINGLFGAAISTILTLVNADFAKLTEKFKYKGLDCWYTLSDFRVYQKSIIMDVVMFSEKGALNDPTAAVPIVMEPHQAAVLYIEEDLMSNVFSAIIINYKQPIDKAEAKEAFPEATESLWLNITLDSAPKALITPEATKTAFSLVGSIQNSEGVPYVKFKIGYWTNVNVVISSGIVKPSFIETMVSDPTPYNAADNDTLLKLQTSITKHVKSLARAISCNLGEIPVPKPIIIDIKNARCINQQKQLCCIQLTKPPCNMCNP